MHPINSQATATSAFSLQSRRSARAERNGIQSHFVLVFSRLIDFCTPVPTSRRHWLVICALTQATLCGVTLTGGRISVAADITLSSTVVGLTPERVGYNSGHFLAGSNTAAWWRYSQANGARVWSTPATVEGTDDNGIWGDGVTTQQQFINRRAALRVNPLDTAYINWPHFENGYRNNPTTGSNNVSLYHAFSELHAMGVQPVIEMHRSNAAYPFDPAGTSAGWSDRWEQWHHFYAQAFYLAKNFDVHRFQMYNEPNHSSNDITQAEYIERLRLSSDAVQSAVADVNALYGKSLDPQMHAPVTAGGSIYFNERPGGDARDDTTGWGELVMQNLHTNYLGQVDLSFQLVDTYAAQLYNMDGLEFANEMLEIKNHVNTAAGGSPMRFAITEFGVHTAAVFETTAETMDSPSKFSMLGSILANLANTQVEELYLQKFSLTQDTSASGVKKNGLHYVDNTTSPYDIGDSTKGGEVSRLFNKGFAGAIELMANPIATGAGAGSLQLSAAHDSESGRYSLLSSNVSTSSANVNLNLSSWGVAPGAIVTVEEVSSDRHGEVRQLIQVPASGQISLSQPGQSVFLVTVPEEAPAYSVTLGATDDAMVKAGGNATSNFGSSQTLYAKNDPTQSGARNASFIKFDIGDINSSAVEQAILRVHGENEGADATVITHVYGLLGDNWDEGTINWNNAPNLDHGLGTVNDISHNFVEGIGTTAEIVGHFTGTQTARELMLDVTQFVQAHPDQQITFMIAREVRFDGENVDDAFTSLRLDSKESDNDAGPQLLLSLNAAALPADFNGDGMVDGDDLNAWKIGAGMNGDAGKANGDADGDGDVDGSDFLQWQQALGDQLVPTANAIAANVPEPSAALLAGWMLSCFTIVRWLY
jgi:hypothetical protein